MFACGKPDPGRWTESLDLLRDMNARGLEPTVRNGTLTGYQEVLLRLL
jgi:hypothetical protein